MPLDKKNVAFPFLKGRNDKPAKKNQVNGELTEMENMICLKTGQLQGRKGFIREANTVPAIAGQQAATTVTTGQTLINSGNETVILDGRKAYSRGDAGMWIDRGEVVACEYEQKPIDTTPMGTSAKPTVCRMNGLEVQVWVEQPYDRMTYREMSATTHAFVFNGVEDEYRQKNAVMYYQVVSTVSGSVVIPKTAIEEQVTRIRSAGQWSVPLTIAADSSGTPIGFTGDILGKKPLLSSGGPDDYIAVTKEQVNGNIAILKQMTDATVGVGNKIGMIESLPTVWTATDKGSDGGATDSTPATVPTDGWIWEKTFESSTEEVALYIDYTKGDNTMYYQMKPKLIAVPDANCIVLLYANGDNTAATAAVSGVQRVFYRTIDMTTGQIGTMSASGKAFPALGGGTYEVVLDRRHPSWDADVFFSSSAGTGDAGGFCIGYETAPASVQHTGGEDNTVKIGTWGVTRSGPSIVFTAAASVTQSGIKLRPMYKNVPDVGSTEQFARTWFESPLSGPADQPIPCGLAIRCIAKYDTSTKKLVSDSTNRLILAMDYDGVGSSSLGFEAQILLRTLTTAGVATATEGLFDGTGSPKVPTNIGDVDASVVRLVDMGVAQGVGTSFAGYYQVICEVVDPDSGSPLFLEGDYGATTNPTFLIAKKTGVALPQVLFRGVSLISDGLCDPENVSDSYWCVSQSGQPQSSEDADIKMMGRICMINFTGRIVATWEQFSYATTSDSGWFSTGTERVFENNICLKEQRSRLCITPDVPVGDMIFGINQWDKGILIYEQDWMLPCVAKFTLNPAKPYANTVGQGSVYIASGILWKYAGSKFTENEFLHGPQVAFPGTQESLNGTYEAGSEGGHPTWEFTPKGGLEVGSYKYYFNYFWRDASGDQHASDYITIPDVVILADNSAAKFRIYGLQLTNHRRIAGTAPPQNSYPIDAVVQVWRTLADNMDGPAYLIQVVPMEENKRYYDILDDPPILSGATLGRAITNPQLAPGINTAVAQIDSGFPHLAPECPVGICFHRGHLIVSTTKNTIWASRQLEANFTATFTAGGVDENVNMFLFVPNPLERITHVQSVGTSFYCFSRDNVYSYSGDGPDSSGTGDYSGPEVVAPNMGIRPDGICEKIPDGLVYQSQKGYYLLQGGQSRPIYFGGPIADYEYAVPVGCAIDDKEQHIIIALGGSTSVCLIYNWEFQTWGTHHFSNANSVNEIAGIVSHTDAEGIHRVALLGADGYFWRQKIVGTDARPWEDEKSGSYYAPPQKISTTWLQLPEFHSSFRVYKIGAMFSVGGSGRNGSFTLQTYTDWDTTETGSHTLVWDTTGTGAEVEPLEMVVRPTVQKCKTFKVTLTSTHSLGIEPPFLDGLAFLVGTRKPSEYFTTQENLEGA